MDPRLTETHQAVRRAVREFAERELASHVMEWDEAQQFPDDLRPRLADLGLLGIQVPAEYGGAGMSAVEYCICIEELARIDPSIALSVAAHNGLSTAHVLMFGSDEQRRTVLPRLAGGETLGAWALTEPGAGSDAGAMRTTATADGDGWVIDGVKTFITHGSLAGVVVVMAVTDPGAGHRGVSAFIVERGTPGLTVGRKANKLGMRASDTAELHFTACRIGAGQQLGVAGEGFVQALRVLDAGRIGIAALSVGLAQGAFEAARRYALDREQFGQPVASFQAIQWKLADMATRIDAARLLVQRAAWLRDQGQPTRDAAARAKLFAASRAVAACSEALQIHGGYGYTREFPVERFLRDARYCPIADGTDEIQRIVLSESIARRFATA